jgi:alcohol dehydrogenase class IV
MTLPTDMTLRADVSPVAGVAQGSTRAPVPERQFETLAAAGMPTEIAFGEGSLELLPEVLDRAGIRRAFVVASRGTIDRGLPTPFEQLFFGIDIHVFSDFEPVPKLDDLRRSLKQAKDYEPRAFVAIGGGTAMDLAKATALLASQGDAAPESFLGGQRKITAPRRDLLVLIPTTSGTGSEVTQFAVIYIGKEKFSLDHPYAAADHAIVDPRLSWTMPSTLAAVTGLDALSQAIESYWSVKSTEVSRGCATAAIKLILANLPSACLDPTRPARERMCLAALRAGQAINITRTTASHAVSYPLTALYGIPHGQACALTLPQFLHYNALVEPRDVLDPRGADHVRARIRDILELLGAATPEMGRQRVTDMMTLVGLETRLSAFGIAEREIDDIVARSFNPERIANNPRRVTKTALREMLMETL